MNGISKTQYDALVCHIAIWGSMNSAISSGIESFTSRPILAICVFLLLLRAWWLERKMEGDRK